MLILLLMSINYGKIIDQFTKIERKIALKYILTYYLLIKSYKYIHTCIVFYYIIISGMNI